jgi:hypothetical protein
MRNEAMLTADSNSPGSPLGAAIGRLDERIDVLLNFTSQLRHTANSLCGAEPEAAATVRPQAVPNGLADRIDERVVRIELIILSLSRDISRLENL